MKGIRPLLHCIRVESQIQGDASQSQSRYNVIMPRASALQNLGHRAAMRQWTIRARIVASFGVVLALILLLAGGAFVELSRMVRATRSLQVDAMGGLQQGELLQAAWYDTDQLIHQYAF